MAVCLRSCELHFFIIIRRWETRERRETFATVLIRANRRQNPIGESRDFVLSNKYLTSRPVVSYVQTENDNHVRLRSCARKYWNFFPNLEHSSNFVRSHVVCTCRRSVTSTVLYFSPSSNIFHFVFDPSFYPISVIYPFWRWQSTLILHHILRLQLN